MSQKGLDAGRWSVVGRREGHLAEVLLMDAQAPTPAERIFASARAETHLDALIALMRRLSFLSWLEPRLRAEILAALEAARARLLAQSAGGEVL